MTQSLDERLGLPSASSWRRYELCAGSFQLEQEARRLNQLAHESSPAAQCGELIHAWLAGVPDADGNEIKLDDSEQQTADFLQERATEQVRRIFGDEPTSELAEERLWDPLKRFSGRFDRVIYTPAVALVQDFKTGWAEPDPAEQNSQMKVLAVLVGLNLPRTLRKVIVQVISGPFGVTEAAYDYPALAKAYDDILRTLRAIQDPLAPLTPSPEACRYCPAINVCQAVKDLIAPVAKLQVSALPEGARGAKLLDEVELLQEHLDSIKKYYSGRLSADPAFDLPGYALVPGAPRRSVTDWVSARAKLEEFVDVKALSALATFSIPAVEKLLSGAIGVKGPRLKEQLAMILGDLLELKYPEPSLKRVSSKPKSAVFNLKDLSAA